VTVVIAYVMIKANTGEADRLSGDVGAIEGVVSSHIVAGDVDMIAKLEVETPEDVKRVAADEIQQISGVESTETFVAMT
jgi:DNA-binding Lrp family transcriptional regulator